MRISASLILILSAVAPAVAQVSVLTYHNDNLRSGLNAKEKILTPTNVNSTTFGKLFVLPADGKVDAQPLYVPSLSILGGTHNVVYVASEHDTVYAYDADNGALLWQVTMLAAGETPSDSRSCSQVTPEIGVTATPAIDLSVGTHGTMYVVAMTKDSSGGYHHRLHALDLTTGGEEAGSPVEVQATYPGNGPEGSGGIQTFNPAQHKERAALLLANGKLITSWSSHCDIPPYTGWVIAYDKKTLAQTSILNMTPNGGYGAVWGAGSGPSSDGSGFIYYSVANGAFDPTLNASGFPINADFGNAIVKVGNGASLAVTDYFDMYNTVSESSNDIDLGSAGAILLPPLNDAGGTSRKLAAVAGKDQNIYVVDRENMGKFNPNSNNVYEEIPLALAGQNFSAPVYYNKHLYFGASGDAIRSYQFTNGLFGMTPVAVTSHTFGYPGAFLSMSANGARTPILWATESTSPAVLHAYNAGSLAELYNSNQAGTRDQFGNGNKYIVPTIVNGKVYVGTQTGVGVFGLLGQ